MGRELGSGRKGVGKWWWWEEWDVEGVVGRLRESGVHGMGIDVVWWRGYKIKSSRGVVVVVVEGRGMEREAVRTR